MLLSANVFWVRNLDVATREAALRFIDSWSAEDEYDRFGSVGIGGRRWLAAELSERSRPALVALHDGAVLGLLDFTHAAGELHIGIVVDSKWRRTSIGKALVATVVESQTRALPVVAECSSETERRLHCSLRAASSASTPGRPRSSGDTSERKRSCPCTWTFIRTSTA